ncbi:MAG: hypothetical protein VKQ33_00295 [Candidatus Sericytochromatia bacterium]|nr:hypothetical protein [Candidatus Sericytochromatia bacterium]
MRLLLPTILAATLAAAPVATASPRGPQVPLGRFSQDEVSGLTPSRRHPGVFWAIQDSGDGQRAVLLAVRVEAGRVRPWPGGALARAIPVRGTINHDWEEVAADAAGNLWIADMGNNDEDREDLALLRVPEPDPGTARSATVTARVPFRYPDAPWFGGSFNAEALFFHAGRAYLITKTAGHGLYRFPPLAAGRQPLVPTRLGSLAQPPRGFEGLVTGAGLSDDGARLVVAAGRRRAYVYVREGPPSRGQDPILALVSQPPRWAVPYAPDHRAWQVEAVCFRPGSHDVLAAAEEGPLWLFPASFCERQRP